MVNGYAKGGPGGNGEEWVIPLTFNFCEGFRGFCLLHTLLRLIIQVDNTG